MECTNFIYRFLNKEEVVIYVGKTTNLLSRLNSHKNAGHLPSECYESMVKIEVLAFKEQGDMDLAEIYYISKFSPMFNSDHKDKVVTFSIPFLDNQQWVDFEEANSLHVQSSTEQTTFYLFKREYLSERLILERLAQDPSALRYIPSPTYDMQLLAVSLDGNTLEFVEEQTPQLCQLAVEQNGLSLRFVKEQTQELAQLAVRQNGLALQFVQEPLLMTSLWAVEQNPHALQYVSEKTSEICLRAIQRDLTTFKYLDLVDQTEEVCLEAVRQSPDLFKNLTNQTETVALLAMGYDGLLIRYSQIKTPIVLQVALRQNGLALRFIEKELQTPELCELSIEQNPEAFRYAQHQTEKMCWDALRYDGSLIKRVSKTILTEEMCWFVLKQDVHLINEIPRPFVTEEMQRYCLEQDGTSLKNIHQQTEALCWIAIRQNPKALLYVKSFSEPLTQEFYNHLEVLSEEVSNHEHEFHWTTRTLLNTLTPENKTPWIKKIKKLQGNHPQSFERYAYLYQGIL